MDITVSEILQSNLNEKHNKNFGPVLREELLSLGSGEPFPLAAPAPLLKMGKGWVY